MQTVEKSIEKIIVDDFCSYCGKKFNKATFKNWYISFWLKGSAT